MHGQELSLQDGSPSDANTVTKEEFTVDELTTQTTTVQKCKLQNKSNCELLNVISAIPESLDSPCSDISVIIKEELILEGTNEEPLADKVLYNITLILLY